MTLEEICKVLDAKMVTSRDRTEYDFTSVCAADLMSDVLAFTSPEGILLTGLSNVQSVITAHVAEVMAIVYVRGKRPEADAVKLAEQKKIPLLTCPLSMFEACGRLYEVGLTSATNLGKK